MTENKDMKHTLFKKQDLILIAVVLAAAALLFLGTKLMHKSPAEVVEISVDGNVVETLDLAKDQELTIDGVSGGTNHLIIKDGEVWVSEATCPDKICVHQGKIHMDGEIIVCRTDQEREMTGPGGKPDRTIEKFSHQLKNLRSPKSFSGFHLLFLC